MTSSTPKYKIGWMLHIDYGEGPEHKFLINHIDNEYYYYSILDFATSTFITYDKHYINAVDNNKNIVNNRLWQFNKEMKEILAEPASGGRILEE